jgi:hydroxypyruvate isomerase
MSNDLSRRQTLLATLAAAVGMTVLPTGEVVADETKSELAITNNRLKQTICAWCFPKWKLDELCRVAVKLGYKGIDLVEPTPETLATLKSHNLMGTMVKSHPINPGLNRKENHEKCLAEIRKGIDFASAAGFPNVICFSGNRAGMAEDEGLNNCAEALKRIVGYADEKKVTICMELLNSKVNHKDYMCDNSDWGIKLCKKVGSERFKLLYDIYHMQIMEGNVIATIKKSHEYFAHYHTAGVPGRHEIDDTQELYYPAVMKAIAETGHTGWVGQEFLPTKDPAASLAQAGKICDV